MGRNKASVELSEGIRREYEFRVGSMQGVARKLGVHRRLVREAVASAMPVQRKRPQRARSTIPALYANAPHGPQQNVVEIAHPLSCREQPPHGELPTLELAQGRRWQMTSGVNLEG
jgi:hypothetical protein